MEQHLVFGKRFCNGLHSNHAIGRYNYLLDVYLVFGCCYTRRIRNSTTVQFSILGENVQFCYFLEAELGRFIASLRDQRTMFNIALIAVQFFTFCIRMHRPVSRKREGERGREREREGERNRGGEKKKRGGVSRGGFKE